MTPASDSAAHSQLPAQNPASGSAAHSQLPAQFPASDATAHSLFDDQLCELYAHGHHVAERLDELQKVSVTLPHTVQELTCTQERILRDLKALGLATNQQLDRLEADSDARSAAFTFDAASSRADMPTPALPCTAYHTALEPGHRMRGAAQTVTVTETPGTYVVKRRGDHRCPSSQALEEAATEDNTACSFEMRDCHVNNYTAGRFGRVGDLGQGF